ncbi:unannotated protein [freshwater metagenome]|uniref:Unannotated protein n=1 Tax=freshwater metagenome TaxID=449393 RepID=A0A6J6G935_9ZZZZ
MEIDHRHLLENPHRNDPSVRDNHRKVDARVEHGFEIVGDR